VIVCSVARDNTKRRLPLGFLPVKPPAQRPLARAPSTERDGLEPGSCPTIWTSNSMGVCGVEPNLWPSVLLACLRLSRGVEMISAA
jgi:hypothetical protein